MTWCEGKTGALSTTPAPTRRSGERRLQLLRHQLEGIGLQSGPVGHEDDWTGSV